MSPFCNYGAKFKTTPNYCSPRTLYPILKQKAMNCFKMRGKKGDEHFDPLDPPRRRANKRRGRGTYKNDRPPVLGVIGRQSGEVRLRVVVDTKASTLEEHVHAFTLPTHTDAAASETGGPEEDAAA